VKWNSDPEATLDKVELIDDSTLPFKSRKIGKGKIIVSLENGFTTSVTSVIVKPGKLAYLQVEDKPNGEGKEVFAMEITTDESRSFYSIGYDKTDNLIGNVSANWQTTPKLELVQAEEVEIFNFAPEVAMVTGTIKADIPGIIGDETGKISTSPGKAAYISIVDGNNKSAKKVKKLDITVGDKVVLYAAAYDKFDIFLRLYEIDWTLDSDLEEDKKIKNKTAIDFQYNKGPQKIIVSIKHPKIKIESDVVVNVALGAPHKLFVSSDPDKVTTETYTITADETLQLYSWVHDKLDNLIGKPAVQWNLKGLSGGLSDKESNIVEFTPDKVGQGTISAQYTAQGKTVKAKVKVNVLPGEVARLVIKGTNNFQVNDKLNFFLNKKIKLTSFGFDNNDNDLGSIKVSWTKTDDIGKLKIEKDQNAYVLTSDYIVTNGRIEAKIGNVSSDISFSAQRKKIIKPIATDNIVLYFGYNGQNISKLISSNLGLKYIWTKIKPFVQAVIDYNKIKDMNLIFPKQPIKIPYTTVDEPTTKRKIAIELFEDESKKDMFVIYKKDGENISVDDKIIILDVEFLRTGKMNIEIHKKLKK
jgi:hypothetical protein